MSILVEGTSVSVAARKDGAEANLSGPFCVMPLVQVAVSSLGELLFLRAVSLLR